ncbi:MAG TPA: porin [Pseudomonadales bacterium]
MIAFRYRTGGVLFVMGLVTAAARAAEVRLDDGLSVQSGDYRFRLGGRVMWDADSFDGALNRDHDGERRFDAYLRRARIELSADVHPDVSLQFDVDVHDGAEVHTAGIEYRGWSWADVFVGRTKEPFGLEELTSSNAISTIERNWFTEATDADGQPHFGVLLSGRVGPLGWAAGVFNPEGNPEREDGGDRFAVTGRLFGTPILSGARVLHLGAAYTDRNLDQPLDAAGFELDVAEGGGELDSATLQIAEDRQLGLEALYIDGRFSVQAEAFRRDMPGADGGPDGRVDDWYLQATWTVTGESRGYKRDEGVPDMIEPSGRRGAVELVAKIDRIRFDVDGRPDQKVDGLLLGANWYPIRHVKLMANVIRVSSDGVVGRGEDDDATVFSTRVQFAF